MIHTFGLFAFDDESGELRKNGRAVALEPQPAKALALLLSKGGDIVSRADLRDAVWGQDTHVDFDRGLAYCLSQIRTALGDSADNPRFVQTVPKRGFRFIAPLAPTATPANRAGTILPNAIRPLHVPWRYQLVAVAVILLLLGGVWAVNGRLGTQPKPVIVGVSIFDNETGLAEHDRLVAGLSDLVVARLAAIDPDRIAVVGNATVLRQPRNIRNLKAVAEALDADFVLLGQLQRGQGGLRFITHFIRLRDEAHLKANRLTMPGGGVDGLEAGVVEEFERAVRDHILTPPVTDSPGCS